MPNEEADGDNYIPVNDESGFNNNGLLSIRGLYDPFTTDRQPTDHLSFMPHLQLDQNLQVFMMGQENPNYITDNFSTDNYPIEERISLGSHRKNDTFFRPSTKWVGK